MYSERLYGSLDMVVWRLALQFLIVIFILIFIVLLPDLPPCLCIILRCTNLIWFIHYPVSGEISCYKQIVTSSLCLHVV